MLPHKKYFSNVPCPDNDEGSCCRPYCHFFHKFETSRKGKLFPNLIFVVCLVAYINIFWRPEVSKIHHTASPKVFNLWIINCICYYYLNTVHTVFSQCITIFLSLPTMSLVVTRLRYRIIMLVSDLLLQGFDTESLCSWVQILYSICLWLWMLNLSDCWINTHGMLEMFLSSMFKCPPPLKLFWFNNYTSIKKSSQLIVNWHCIIFMSCQHWKYLVKKINLRIMCPIWKTSELFTFQVFV